MIRARKKPHFGLPWLAVLLGLGTGVFAVQGIQAVTAQPEAQLEIIVEGQHPLNISQATVDAVLAEPIQTWKPLRLLVTPRLLSADEKRGRIDPGADVILSTAVYSDYLNSSEERRFTGVGIYPAPSDHGGSGTRSPGYDIHRAYMDNVGIGHGPAAVAAAAQRAAAAFDDGPIRSPLFWLTGTAIGLALTILALAFSLSRRKRREAIFRRLTAAQRQLASVVLDLDALEVSYQATPEDQRAAGFTATWHTIRDASLALARTEDAAMEAVYSSKSALTPATGALVDAYAAEAQRLVAKADALMGASAVLGRLDGGQGVLDRLAAPMTFAARELLARVESRPTGVVSAKRVKRLKDALNALLVVLAGEQKGTPSIQAWKTAEIELHSSAAAINRSLRRSREARVRAAPKSREDVSALRLGLGLLPTGSVRTLTSLDDANAAAHALLGPLPGSNEAPAAAIPEFSWGRFLAIIFKPSRKVSWVLGCIVIALVSIVVSGFVVAQLPQSPGRELKGTHALQSLTFDGDTSALDEAKIRSSLRNRFPAGMEITVAVRNAADYLGVYPWMVSGSSVTTDKLGSQILLDAMWRLKDEFPELVDPSTGELLPGQTIIPVWSLGDGRFNAETSMSGAVALGEYASVGDSFWEYGHFYFSENVEYSVRQAIEDYARGIQANNQSKPEVNYFWVFVLLSLSIGLGLVVLAMIVSYGGAISTKLGRFGRSAATLVGLRRDLDSLALGLDDSRINAVAMLGRGKSAPSAQSDQRIFESALAMAWRMADDLAAQSLSQRLGAAYVADVEKLQQLVLALGVRDNDVQQRTRKLLDATMRRPLQ